MTSWQRHEQRVSEDADQLVQYLAAMGADASMIRTSTRALREAIDVSRERLQFAVVRLVADGRLVVTPRTLDEPRGYRIVAA